MLLGAKIKSLIDISGQSVNETADKLGMSHQNLYNMFKKESVDTKYLVMLSRMFGVPMSYFFDDSLPPMSVRGNGNQAIAGHNNLVGGGGSDGRVAALEEKVALLERLLEEKERYIRLLEGRAVRGS